MASKKFTPGCEEHKTFNEFWKLVQKYYIPEDADVYWQGVMDDFNEFAKKNTLARSLALGFIDFLERKYKHDKSK